MSIAFKCDRCWQLFDPVYSIDPFSKINELIFQDGISFKDNKVTHRYSKLDLCPECTKKLADFLFIVDDRRKPFYDKP